MNDVKGEMDRWDAPTVQPTRDHTGQGLPRPRGEGKLVRRRGRYGHLLALACVGWIGRLADGRAAPREDGRRRIALASRRGGRVRPSPPVRPEGPRGIRVYGGFRAPGARMEPLDDSAPARVTGFED